MKLINAVIALRILHMLFFNWVFIALMKAEMILHARITVYLSPMVICWYWYHSRHTTDKLYPYFSIPVLTPWVQRNTVNLYNVNITGSFAGLFPSSFSIESKKHAAAVRHYKRALRASVVKTGSQIVLESSYGFRFKVNPSRSSSQTSVRLSLPNSGQRGNIARALGAGGRVSHHRTGLVVQDPYGVTWTLAWTTRPNIHH